MFSLKVQGCVVVRASSTSNPRINRETRWGWARLTRTLTPVRLIQQFAVLLGNLPVCKEASDVVHHQSHGLITLYTITQRPGLQLEASARCLHLNLKNDPSTLSGGLHANELHRQLHQLHPPSTRRTSVDGWINVRGGGVEGWRDRGVEGEGWRGKVEASPRWSHWWCADNKRCVVIGSALSEEGHRRQAN